MALLDWLIGRRGRDLVVVDVEDGSAGGKLRGWVFEERQVGLCGGSDLGGARLCFGIRGNISCLSNYTKVKFM